MGELAWVRFGCEPVPEFAPWNETAAWLGLEQVRALCPQFLEISEGQMRQLDRGRLFLGGHISLK